MPVIKHSSCLSTRLLALPGDNTIANVNQTIAEIRETLLQGLDTATLSPLGEGGFGTTQLASFPSGARCVVKTIAKHAPTEATAIFKAEAEALKGLDHPQIPKLLGAGTASDGLPYILQQYIPGQNLEQIFKSAGDWELDAVKEMVRAIASILTYLHRKGLAHRDVKPQNILRNESGYYLVDFGSSKIVNDRTGTVIGSFAYAAPEQVMGKACARSDIYSLGMTAVHLLTGLNERELVDPATDEWLWVGIYEEKWSDRTFLDLLKSMLERGTSKRPSAAEVVDKLSPKEIVRSDSWEWDEIDQKCWEKLGELCPSQQEAFQWFTPFEKLPSEGHLVMGKYLVGGTRYTRTMRMGDVWKSQDFGLMEQPYQWRYLTQRERGAIAPNESASLQDPKKRLFLRRIAVTGYGTALTTQIFYVPNLLQQNKQSLNEITGDPFLGSVLMYGGILASLLIAMIGTLGTIFFWSLYQNLDSEE